MTVHARRLFHPTLHVPDLDAAVAWFERVFGRPSQKLEGSAQAREIAARRPGYPTDYAAFTAIGEVLFESLCPDRLITDGRQTYASVTEPVLRDLGWYVDGLGDLYDTLEAEGIRCTRQAGSDPEARPPRAAFADLVLYWSDPRDTGIRYEFYDPRGGYFDHRKDPAWSLETAPDCDPASDPLGILLCSHHTVLTGRPERAQRLLVELLGGTVVHRGVDEHRGTETTYVALADGVVEIATPADGTPAAADLARRDGLDAYHALTFVVRDLEQVAAHLAVQGAALRVATDDTIIIEPAEPVGVPFGFTTGLLPGDGREELLAAVRAARERSATHA